MEYLKPSNLLNLVISPTKVFQKVKEKPDFVILDRKSTRLNSSHRT